jgi:hypothetical protein
MLTDSDRTSASTGLPTPVDDGTPAGHPTPAGEPSTPAQSSEQSELFPGMPLAVACVADGAALEAIGAIVLAWGRLERTTADKVAVMRRSFGDVRAVGGRTRPTMPKLLAELRALVAMRDRHDKQALAFIAEIDGALQRIAQVRQLVLEGAQDVSGDIVICHNVKNSPTDIAVADIRRQVSQVDRIRSQIAAL